MTDKIRPVTDADIAEEFEKHKAEFDGDLASSRAMIAEYLNEDARDQAETAFYSRLRAAASVHLSLVEPAPVVLALPTQGPSRGRLTAPVTIVEFADFECPPCGRMYLALEETMKPYGDRVRLVFRQFPLAMHPHAPQAAEAALSANAQGRFWEFADRLFRNQKALDEASLVKYAQECGLDTVRFERDLQTESYAASVVHDIREGRRFGLKGTPTFFINGVRLQSLGPEGFRQAIDSALVNASRTPKKHD